MVIFTATVLCHDYAKKTDLNVKHLTISFVFVYI